MCAKLLPFGPRVPDLRGQVLPKVEYISDHDEVSAALFGPAFSTVVERSEKLIGHNCCKAGDGFNRKKEEQKCKSVLPRPVTMEITDAIRGHTEEKISRELAEFLRVQSVHVILPLVEKYRHIAEIIVPGPTSHSCGSEGRVDDMYVSIDRAAERSRNSFIKCGTKLPGPQVRERWLMWS